MYVLRWLVLLLSLVLTTLAATCEGSEQTAPPDSGVQGQVLLGPTCPVVRLDNPCPDRPFPSTVEVWDAGRSRQIASVATDQDGRFRIPLPPGTYRLEPVKPNPGPFPVAKPETIVVPAGTFVDVTLHFDSGIR